MQLTRRKFLGTGTAGMLGLPAWVAATDTARNPAMGLVIHSYSIRRSADPASRLDDPLAFLDYARSLGAGGVQTSLGVRDEAYAARLRERLTQHGLYVEAVIALPREPADVGRFTSEVQTAKACGATVARTVLMNGRRYEVFRSGDEFRKFLELGKQALQRARPVVEKHELQLAVENHKDLQAAEQVELLTGFDSPWIGICLDSGNNLALLEAPQETADLLAPRTFTTHIKDMSVAEYTEGFLLAEVPLGSGFLDLNRIVQTVRKHRPGVRLNLEMITRNPLPIPCLTPNYWTTLEHVRGRRLAEMLALVRARAAGALPRMDGLNREQQLAREDANVRECLRFAREHLG